jgi:uncharacterized protein YjbI with pentapeptide repeats
LAGVISGVASGGPPAARAEFPACAFVGSGENRVLGEADVERCIVADQPISGVTLEARAIQRALAISSRSVRITNAIIRGPLILSASDGRRTAAFEALRLCGAAPSILPPKLCDPKAVDLPSLLSEIDIRDSRFLLRDGADEAVWITELVLRRPLRLVNVTARGAVRLGQVLAAAPVVIERSTFDGGIHIRSSIFGEELRLTGSRGTSLSVGESSFAHDLDASNVELRHDSFVNQSRFRRNWTFRAARLGGLVIGNSEIHGAFDASAARIRQTVKHALWLYHNEFRGLFRLVNVTLEGRTVVAGRFLGDADLGRASFHGPVLMRTVTFCRSASFVGAVFADTAEIDGVFLDKALLSNAVFERPVTLGAYIRAINLDGASFRGGVTAQALRIEAANAGDVPPVLAAAGAQPVVAPIPEAELRRHQPECYR